MAAAGAGLEVVHRTLRVAESGGSRITELGVSSLEAKPAPAESTSLAATPIALPTKSELLGELTALFAHESGYEPSDLEPAFELEADLGIDTVKQAEIFTTIRERYGLPRDDEFRLSDVPTLNAVVDYVLGQLAKGGAIPAASAAQGPGESTAQTPARSDAPLSATLPSKDALLSELTALFAEESGYEPSDLEPAFELEADLGIDTVKQAEIFTTIRERYGLPRDDEFRLSDVQTLHAVVDYVLSQLRSGGSVAAPESGPTPSSSTGGSEQPAAASDQTRRVDKGELLVEITQLFAEESGYDVSDLEPAFELEADLGIDTVKQAEIFTTLRERYGLPRDDEFKLSDVPTLNAVVDYVADQLSLTSARATSEPATQSSLPDRDQLLVEVTQLFAEESGYEVADLEPAFELEADLGIDTVKQAEIFTALRERYGLPRDDEFKLSDVQTLNAVVDYVLDQMSRGDGGSESSLGKTKAVRASAWAAENRFHARPTEIVGLPSVSSSP
ncbi:MAG: acyl carrier protein, partial [Myxococcota bacterium]